MQGVNPLLDGSSKEKREKRWSICIFFSGFLKTEPYFQFHFDANLLVL